MADNNITLRDRQRPLDPRPPDMTTAVREGMLGGLRNTAEALAALPALAMELAKRAPGSPLMPMLIQGDLKAAYRFIAETWPSMSPEDKQVVLDNVGQTGGEILGAVVGGGLTLETGGVGAAPGAIIGGATGLNAARGAGPWLGGSGFEGKSSEDIVRDTTRAATEAAIPEGIAGLAATAKSNKLGLRMLRPLTKPSADQMRLNDVAAGHGLELGLEATSDRPAVQGAAALLRYAPTSYKKMMDRAAKDSIAVTGALRQFGDDAISPGATRPGEVLDLLRGGVQRQRGELDAELARLTGQIPNVSIDDAGRMLERGRQAGRKGRKAVGEELFGPIREDFGGLEIRIDDAAEAAANFLDDEVSVLLNPDSVATLRKLAQQGEPPAGPPSVRQDIFGRMSVAEKTPEPPIVTLQQFMNLESDLRRNSTKLRGAGGMREHAAGRLVKILDDSFQNSVRAGEVPQEAADAIAQAREAYRGMMRAQTPPIGPEAEGNIAYDLLRRKRKEPGEALRSVVRPERPQLLRDAETATGTPEITGPGEVSINPSADMPNVRAAATRSAFLRPTVRGGLPRLSPSRVADRSARYGDAMVDELGFGQQVRGIGSPENIASEENLYKTWRPIFNPTTPETTQIKRFTGTPEIYQDALGKAGPDEARLRRGFYDQEMGSSMGFDRGLWTDEETVNAMRMQRRMNQRSPLLDITLGGDPAKAQEAQDLLDIGKNVTFVERHAGNPSGSARGGAELAALGTIASTAAGMTPLKSAVGFLAGPMLGSKAFTDPKTAKFLTAPSVPFVKPSARGVMAGGQAVRVPMVMGTSEQQRQEMGLPPSPPPGFFDDVPPPPPGFWDQ